MYMYYVFDLNARPDFNLKIDRVIPPPIFFFNEAALDLSQSNCIVLTQFLLLILGGLFSASLTLWLPLEPWVLQSTCLPFHG